MRQCVSSGAAHRGGKGSFPFRCAAVDVGSNAVRFLAASFTAPSAYTVLREERSAVRLGHGVFLTGRLSPKEAAAAVEVLKDYSAQMRALKVTTCRAVATSAVRESANGQAFLERVYKESGLKLEVISGSEEARLVHRAVSSRVNLSSGTWLMVDLGGGSVEVSLADAGGVLWSESHTMGSVRLLEQLAGGDESPGAFLRLLEEYARTLRVPAALEGTRPAGFIATGGNIETLAQMAAAEPDPSGVARFPVAVLRRLIRQLARLGYRERVQQLGLREDRADVILPAAIVYERLARLCGAAEVVVPFVGVREGTVLDLADGLCVGLERRDRREKQVLQAALAVGRKYRFDEAHGLHVARLSLSLFDQLKRLHGSGEEEREALLAAALLHDIGAFVSYKSHHKHSLYLIANSELPGVGPRQLQIVANVARYHRRAPPKPQHADFAALAPADQEAVSKLAALLRLADAMDREHQQKVRAVKVKVSDGALRLAMEGEGDLLLEGWALKRKSDLFRKAYGLEVIVAPGRGGKEEVR